MATRKCTRSPASVNTTREKVSKNTNLNKAAFLLRSYCVLTAFLLRSYCVLTAFLLRSYCVLTAFLLRSYCVLTAFLLRPVRSYHVLTARPPRPLRAYGVYYEIYGLGNGDQGRSCGALTTFSRRLYIKHIKIFGNFQRIIV